MKRIRAIYLIMATICCFSAFSLLGCVDNNSNETNEDSITVVWNELFYMKIDATPSDLEACRIKLLEILNEFDKGEESNAIALINAELS